MLIRRANRFDRPCRLRRSSPVIVITQIASPVMAGPVGRRRFYAAMSSVRAVTKHCRRSSSGSRSPRPCVWLSSKRCSARTRSSGTRPSRPNRMRFAASPCFLAAGLPQCVVHLSAYPFCARSAQTTASRWRRSAGFACLPVVLRPQLLAPERQQIVFLEWLRQMAVEPLRP